MTPREMLAPQPAPEPGLHSVTDWLLELTPPDRDGELVRELLRLRREQGAARYGGELMTSNGRSAIADQLQEAVDLLLYAAQARQELQGRTADWRMRIVYALVVDLARELEQRPTASTVRGGR